MKPEFIALGLIIASALYLFWTQKLRTDITALLVMLCLAIPWPHQDGKWAGILTPQEAFAGFGSVAVIMVTAMFVFSAALVRTGAAEMIGGRLFRAASSNELLFQAAVFALATACSMFVNETTIVLVFMPVVLGVCKERNLSPSRYLLCAAYGAALGGQWTLIGTRSNIIISEFFRQRTGHPIGFFDFTPVAATVFVGCSIYFFLVARRFLPAPDVQSLEQELGKEYLSEVMITPDSATVGLTLDQLEWAKRQDATIVGVIREGERMPPNGWMKLHAGDALIVQGAVPIIGSLLKSPDFTFVEEVKIGDKALRSLDLITVEALLSPNSRYTGRTMQETNFGRDYGFSVLGISRHGQTIQERPTATQLQYGDSLLLLGHNSNLERLERNPNLIVLSQRHFPNTGKKQAAITMLLLLGVILSAITGALTPALSIPIAAAAVLLFKCVKVTDTYKSVDWPAVATVGGMISFGFALEKTGAAAALAHAIVSNFQWAGPGLILGAMLLFTVTLTQIIENAAVAIILAPIAYQIAHESGTDPKPFMIGLAVCISTSFCTPVAHETTMLVMGPGRYRFKHYLTMGTGMAIAAWLIATYVTPLIWRF
ncbi:MAG: SLC13 family permease [Verrucomicrobia bacterium]|nr:SLC13 family permease [Verrucomicrobiota bacterium]MBV8482303.1 SLC13 family permease [Verrucomicrobiota bacterium]